MDMYLEIDNVECLIFDSQIFILYRIDNSTINDKVEISDETASIPDMAKNSTLNPHAAEFVPSWDRTSINPDNLNMKAS